MSNTKNIYAIYKGDRFLYMGTSRECADFLKVRPETIRFYSYPSYRKKVEKSKDPIIVIKVEDDD